VCVFCLISFCFKNEFQVCRLFSCAILHHYSNYKSHTEVDERIANNNNNAGKYNEIAWVINWTCCILAALSWVGYNVASYFDILSFVKFSSEIRSHVSWKPSRQTNALISIWLFFRYFFIQLKYSYCREKGGERKCSFPIFLISIFLTRRIITY
jgi:hypothetical protein